MKEHCPKFLTALQSKHPHNPQGKNKFQWKYMQMTISFTPLHASTLNKQSIQNTNHPNSNGCHLGLDRNKWKFQNPHETQHNFQWQNTGTEQTHIRNFSPEQKKRPITIRKMRHWKPLTPITQNLCFNQAPAYPFFFLLTNTRYSLSYCYHLVTEN